MLEAVLLTVLTALPSTQADAGRRSRPSLELLEFLGEFGDDEEGLFDNAAGARAPAVGADKAAPTTPVKARPPASPPAASPAPVSPPPAAKEHP